MNFLAETDWVTIGLGTANIVFSGVIGLVVVWLGLNFKKIGALETDLKAATRELVGAEIRHAREVYAVEISGLMRDIADLRNDLARGASRFVKNEAETNAVRVEVLKAISELKDVVATKDDLKTLRQEMRDDR